MTIISFVIGLVIALGVALARLSTNVVLSNVARFYISIIRGTPLLVQLFIIFYALPQFGVKLEPFLAAVHRVLHQCRRLRGGDHPLGDPEHPEGSVGGCRDHRPELRRSLRRIVLPQATRVAVPPLSNTLISLVKDTSLASTILVTELLREAQRIAAPKFEFFALYGTAAVYYWVICLVLSFAQSRYERRLERFVAR